LLEDQDVWYVMAIRCSDTLSMPEGKRRADALIGAVPPQPGSGSRPAFAAGSPGPVGSRDRPRPGGVAADHASQPSGMPVA